MKIEIEANPTEVIELVDELNNKMFKKIQLCVEGTLENYPTITLPDEAFDEMGELTPEYKEKLNVI